MSTKLVPRTELLQWLQKSESKDERLGEAYEFLRTGRVLPMDLALYASERYQEDKQVKPIPEPEVVDVESGQEIPKVGTIIGAYRLATDNGPVVFVTVQGFRGPDLIISPGLNLPGELDLQRALIGGKAVCLENILELCKWKP